VLKLIKYEMRKNRNLLLGMLGTIAAAELYFLLSLFFEWETHLVLSAAIMPFGCFLIALLVFILGVTSYSRELGQKSSYLIFMTPHSATAIIASKLLFTLVLGVGFAALLGGLLAMDMPLLLNYFGEWEGYAILLDMLLQDTGLSVAALLMTVLFFALVVFSEVVSILGAAYLSITLSHTLLHSRRGRGLVTLVFFLLLSWLLSYLGTKLIDEDLILTMETTREVYAALFPMVALNLGALLVSLFGSGWLLKKYVTL